MVNYEILYAHDQYLEDIFSWWMIHLKLLTNHVNDIKLHDAPVFYAAFNEFDAKNFKKILLSNGLKNMNMNWDLKHLAKRMLNLMYQFS